MSRADVGRGGVVNEGKGSRPLDRLNWHVFGMVAVSTTEFGTMKGFQAYVCLFELSADPPCGVVGVVTDANGNMQSCLSP